jgi:hypothetical protein
VIPRSTHRVIRVTTLLLNLLVFAVTAAADDSPHVAIVKNLSGDLQVVRDGESVQAQPGTRIFAADAVSSGVDTSAGVAFKDGTLLTLGPSSHVVIRDFMFDPRQQQYAFSLFMRQGTAVYSSGKIAKLSPESVNISTPRATVGVRGTRFIIRAE